MMPQPAPPMWKFGIATRLTSSLVQLFQAAGGPNWPPRMPRRLALVSIAPLGRPVVPEV